MNTPTVISREAGNMTHHEMDDGDGMGWNGMAKESAGMTES
jgi:hypothetical protein